MNSYNLLKSRTFWTLIFMFVADAISVYGNLLNTEMLTLLNLFLTGLASYFHLKTGKSTTGTN